VEDDGRVCGRVPLVAPPPETGRRAADEEDAEVDDGRDEPPLAAGRVPDDPAASKKSPRK
jgi:hypothetical protein